MPQCLADLSPVAVPRLKCRPLYRSSQRALWIFSLLASFSVPALALSPQQPSSGTTTTSAVSKMFPDGPGKDTFLHLCSTCHSPTNVLADGKTREGWEDTITKMAGYGAAGSDEDFTAILEYLTKNFPPLSKVNINKASAEQLEKSLTISAADAEAIVAYREKHGDFKSLDDVKQVPGIDTAKIDFKHSLIIFQ